MKIVSENIDVKRELPNATTVLVLGIIALCSCWNYGIIAFILAVITLVMSSQSRRLYRYNPEQYQYSSYKRVSAGRICAIIALVISIFALLFALLVILGIAGGISLIAMTDIFI